MYTQKKKSGGVKSCECGAQVTALPVSRSLNFSVKIWRTSVLLEKDVIRTLFFQNYHVYVRYIRQYVFDQKKGLNTFCLDIAQKKLNLELYHVGTLSHCRWIVAPPDDVG